MVVFLLIPPSNPGKPGPGPVTKKGKDKSVPVKPVIAFAMRIDGEARGGDGDPRELKPVLDKLLPGVQPAIFDELEKLESWEGDWLKDDGKGIQAKISYNELFGEITVLGRHQGKDLSSEKIEGVTAKNLESKLKEALKQISAWTKQ